MGVLESPGFFSVIKRVGTLFLANSLQHFLLTDAGFGALCNTQYLWTGVNDLSMLFVCHISASSSEMESHRILRVG